jgi:hypothetical protein
LELRVILTSHPEVTHYWKGDDFFSTRQILAGECDGVQLDMAVETQFDGWGRFYVNKVGRAPGQRAVEPLLRQALLSDFEVDPGESECANCVATINEAAKILMVDVVAVRGLITSGQLSARVGDDGEIVVPVLELEELVPEWWTMTKPNRA